jgi:hypothetical protein
MRLKRSKCERICFCCKIKSTNRLNRLQAVIFEGWMGGGDLGLLKKIFLTTKNTKKAQRAQSENLIK